MALALMQRCYAFRVYFFEVGPDDATGCERVADVADVARPRLTIALLSFVLNLMRAALLVGGFVHIVYPMKRALR